MCFNRRFWFLFAKSDCCDIIQNELHLKAHGLPDGINGDKYEKNSFNSWLFTDTAVFMQL